jgi:hypothetical protein
VPGTPTSLTDIKGVGAICDPAAFQGIVEVGADVLGPPKNSQVAVDLVEPGRDPPSWPGTTVTHQEIFRDCEPWVVVRVGSPSYTAATAARPIHKVKSRAQ